MIRNYAEKVNSWIGERKGDLFIAAVVFLVGLGSFGLGRLSVTIPAKPPLAITQPPETGGQEAPATKSGVTPPAAKSPSDTEGAYIGSVSGTAYHFPWCPGALRIKEENKIWFQTKAEAENKGYKPAGNCPGL